MKLTESKQSMKRRKRRAHEMPSSIRITNHSVYYGDLHNMGGRRIFGVHNENLKSVLVVRTGGKYGLFSLNAQKIVDDGAYIHSDLRGLLKKLLSDNYDLSYSTVEDTQEFMQTYSIPESKISVEPEPVLREEEPLDLSEAFFTPKDTIEVPSNLPDDTSKTYRRRNLLAKYERMVVESVVPDAVDNEKSIIALVNDSGEYLHIVQDAKVINKCFGSLEGKTVEFAYQIKVIK